MKRIFLNSCLIVWLFLIEIITWVCLALDNLFYSGYKKIEIRSPLFIIGMPRSASTLCHKLLGSDTDNFTTMKLWEMLFAPSVIQKKLIHLIIRLDHKMNRFISKGVSRFDSYFFRKMENNHPISLFNWEEDHFLFLHIFNSASLAVLFPRCKRLLLMQRFDDEVPECRKNFHMNFYKSCIQRHLYVSGRGRRYLSKNPPNSPRIKTLQSTFTGCQFIYMLRDPFYTIASAICLFKQFRKVFFLHSDDQQITSITLSMADLFYYYPLIECRDLKGKTLSIVTFNEITRDAHQALRNVYDHLGMQFTNEFEEFLLNSTRIINGHKTKNR